MKMNDKIIEATIVLIIDNLFKRKRDIASTCRIHTCTLLDTFTSAQNSVHE